MVQIFFMSIVKTVVNLIQSYLPEFCVNVPEFHVSLYNFMFHDVIKGLI